MNADHSSLSPNIPSPTLSIPPRNALVIVSGDVSQSAVPISMTGDLS